MSELSSPDLPETTAGTETEAPAAEAGTEEAPRWRRFDLETQAAEGLEAAEDALAEGRLVVLPTDTVYGIAADALQAIAVQGLLNAKKRGRDMPPPVLIAEPAMLRALVKEVPVEIDSLINRFWPGALTLIMKAQSALRMDLGRTEGSIAVRVPDNEQARALLRRTGPLAVSSANVSGEPPATTIEQAIAQLGDSVAVYLDGGPTPGPVASTIIDLASTSRGRIVRAGVIGHAELVEVLPGLADVPAPEAADVTAPADVPAQAVAESDPEVPAAQPDDAPADVPAQAVAEPGPEVPAAQPADDAGDTPPDKARHA